jgi:hypothetical protein
MHYVPHNRALTSGGSLYAASPIACLYLRTHVTYDDEHTLVHSRRIATQSRITLHERHEHVRVAEACSYTKLRIDE